MIKIAPVYPALEYLRYAPLSLESFYYYASNGDPQYLQMLAYNQYLPSSEFHFLFDYAGGGRKYARFTALLEKLLNHASVPPAYLEEFVLGFPEIVASNLRTRKATLIKILNHENLQAEKYIAALNPNSPIELASRYLNEYWDVLQGPDKNYVPSVEKRCNEYLASMDWDKETLESTPLNMKLSIVAS